MAMSKPPKMPDGFALPEKGAKGREFIETGSVGQAGASTASEPEPQTPQKQTLPWQAAGVSDRVRRDVLIRMPEPLKLKLDFVLDNTPGRLSMQKYIIGLVEADVEAKLKALGL